MPKKNRTTLKGYFETGDKPTQDEFIDLIDSCFNLKEEENIIFLDPNGKVGIGTTTPSEKLEVNGNAIIGPQIGERLKIGYVGHTDWAGIAHKDHASEKNFALVQSINGATVLNSASDQALYFQNGNSNKMFIKNGKVGIGVDFKEDPQDMLHVEGDGTAISVTDDTVRGRFFSASSPDVQGVYVGSHSDHKLILRTSETNRVIIDTNGNVGIGINPSSEKLEVDGNIKTSGKIEPSAGNNANNGIVFPADPGGGSGDLASIKYYGQKDENGEVTEKTVLEIKVENDSQGEYIDHIALMPSGSVGIGTTNPSEKLEVVDNAVVNSLKIGYMGHTGSPGIAHKDHASEKNFALMQSFDGATALNSAPDQPLYFQNGNSNKMFIKDGKVGIGVDFTKDPQDVLHVEGDGTAISVTNDTVRGRFYSSSAAVYVGSQSSHSLLFLTNGERRVFIDKDGKVGIGKSNPSAELDVNGSIKFSGNIIQEDWKDISLNSRWVNFSWNSTFGLQRDQLGDTKAKYFKDSMGFVHLTGVLQFKRRRSFDRDEDNISIFTLPENYRPSSKLFFLVATFSREERSGASPENLNPNDPKVIEVGKDGMVTAGRIGSADEIIISINEITFRAE